MEVEVLIRLQLEAPDVATAHDVVSNVLDNGDFQDAIDGLCADLDIRVQVLSATSEGAQPAEVSDG